MGNKVTDSFGGSNHATFFHLGASSYHKSELLQLNFTFYICQVKYGSTDPTFKLIL